MQSIVTTAISNSIRRQGAQAAVNAATRMAILRSVRFAARAYATKSGSQLARELPNGVEIKMKEGNWVAFTWDQLASCVEPRSKIQSNKMANFSVPSWLIREVMDIIVNAGLKNGNAPTECPMPETEVMVKTVVNTAKASTESTAKTVSDGPQASWKVSVNRAF